MKGINNSVRRIYLALEVLPTETFAGRGDTSRMRILNIGKSIIIFKEIPLNSLENKETKFCNIFNDAI